jgi:hypothetical protein
MSNEDDDDDNDVTEAPTPEAAKVQQIAGKRGIRPPAKRDFTNVPAPQDPLSSNRGAGVDMAAAGEIAARMAESRRVEREAQAQASARATNSQMSFVQCQSCQGPGIWLAGNGDSTLNNDNWWSSYKGRGMPYPPSRDSVPYCQVCDADKRRVELRMELLTNENGRVIGFRPYSRFIVRMSQDEVDSYNRSVVEAHTKAGGAK